MSLYFFLVLLIEGGNITDMTVYRDIMHFILYKYLFIVFVLFCFNFK